MVSLEAHNEILSLTESNEVINNFHSLINNLEIQQLKILNLHTTDNIILLSIQAIKSSNKSDFSKALNSLSHWNPSSKSAWIYNDILIFVMLLGCKIFNEDTKSIQAILKERKSATEETNSITNVFNQILSNDYLYSGELGFISLVFIYISSKDFPDNKHLTKIYSAIKTHFRDFRNNVFLRILSVRAFDLILEYFPIDSNKIRLFEEFAQKFRSRTAKIATSIYYLIMVIVILFVFYLIYEVIQIPETERKVYNYYINFQNILGFGGFVFIFKKKLLTGWLIKLIYKIFGYKQEI